MSIITLAFLYITLSGGVLSNTDLMKNTPVFADNPIDMPVAMKLPSSVHPGFDLSLSELNDMSVGPFFETSEKARRFLSLIDKMLDMPSRYLLLVDKTHPLAPNYRPEKLKTLPEDVFLVGKGGIQLDSLAYDALLTMTENAIQQGIRLKISSAYRSCEYQKDLFTAYVKRFGETEASRFSAPPGFSQHQLGTAVDFGNIANSFAETPAGKWLMAHARTYGWSLSYPNEGAERITGYKWESWHWRWIGVEATTLQFEFFDDSQQKALEFWNRYKRTFMAVRVPSPKNASLENR